MHQSKKGQGNLYPEPKQKHMIAITPTAFYILDALAKTLKLSRSEVIERILRGELCCEFDRQIIVIYTKLPTAFFDYTES